MRKSIGFGTLGSRIYITFTVMIFATIFIMQLIAFRFTLNTVRNSTLETNQAMLGQLTRQIDSYIQGMERIASAVLDDPGLQRLLTEEGIGGDRLAVQTMLTHYIQARDDISEILIFPPDGSVIASDPEMEINPWTDFTERPWYIEAVAAGGRIVVSGSYVQNLVKGQYSWVVSLSRQIIDADSGKELGVLLVDLKFNRIQELCQSMVIGKKGYNFVIDEQGNYVFHPTQQLVYSDLKREPIDRILDLTGYGERITYSDGERYFMVDTSPLTGWHMVSVLRSDEIITEWSNVQIGYAIIGLVLFLIVGIATNSVTLGITKPIRQLQNTMKSVDTGDFQLVGRIRATEEIRELAREYDIMVSRIRELMQENIREQELKRKSDLKALQAQINPHFLYNTLDSIIWMGEMKQHSEVVLMTSALSKLFRISISKGRELISIKDEIDHVQSYLTIEDMRYRNKFDYIIDVEPALYEFEILKITLQPLVENAIYHGIKEIDGRGRISIKGEKRDDTIVFTVQDNGRGMEAEKLRLLNSALKDPFQEQGRHARGGMGVGIRNVHARLMLYFGEDYGLSCESRRGEGTTITILFPARKGDYPA
ncbi:sensor histidine kinase [Marispirochaeta sp.]|uniref:sensor histidine kinase n=1 Tax=Marispirochaeta sp. TaxID=2038653 RepID=UPI0029C90043|nr:sensor histidine kinase [Marispirochaeta sp.]